MGNPNKDKEHSDTTEGAESITVKEAREAHLAAHNASFEREARDTALAKQVAEAVARERTNAHVHYQALCNERSTVAMPTSFKMTSRALGFKVMDPFDWTKDKATRDS